MARNRQRELALASVAILVLAAAVWTMRSGRPAAGANTPAAVAATGTAQGGGAKKTTEVNLEALGGERPEPEESVRNPFRFKTPPAPSPVVTPPVVKQPQAGQVPTGGPPQPTPPPRITLKYIGDMADPAKPGAKIAILSDSRGVYHGREGEVIEGRYRIVKIGVESVDLAYLDGRGRQTIRQNGQ